MMWQIFSLVGLTSRSLPVLPPCVLVILMFYVGFASAVTAQQATASQVQWQQILKKAQGQTVYFYAWGGAKPVNDYLRWASKEIASRYKIRLQHVKVADITEALSRLKAEDGGKSAIDLLWVNGENFSYLKEQNLLLGELNSRIPNTNLLANEQLPLDSDFGVPIDGFEVPWGVGQFNLIAQSGVFNEATVTPSTLLAAAKQYPGRISYPRPPEFHGTTFLKQLLVALTHSDKRLYAPVTDAAQTELLPVLWAYLEQLHPLTWQQGNAFPSSNTEQLSLFQQNQLVMAVSFNPNQLFKEQSANKIPQSAQRLVFSLGAITNSHNLAIPKGAQSPEAAMVVIDFLLSEFAQTQKLTGEWGDPAVIKALVDEAATLPAQQELHSSWQQVIEALWQQRYGA
ncbi:ABC transporter substrate-binding protein [Flavobacterium sp. W21_SRS_FM6]|uniref:ABC transporter substrate-binding protein n=1 Tax=Flavobacterium sp. W21_SRS_FM6 TaxID=3240268 RepID=UPI003F8F1B19